MAMSRPQVVVVGGANIDICGRADDSLLHRDSNLGSVSITYGGVARNISNNLALLGVNVSLIAPFGDDSFGKEMFISCQDTGIDMSASFVVQNAMSSSYLFICDSHGEMELAINDMAILNELTQGRLADRVELMNSAELVVLDANLEPETLSWLAKHIQVPIFSDPISCAKALRLTPIMKSIHTLKPNVFELETLSGHAAKDSESLAQAAHLLLEQGLSRAFVSRGELGLFVAEGTYELELAPSHSHITATTGAGDAMMAGLIWSYLHDLGLEQSARCGMASAELCAQVPQAVNPQLSEELLVGYMKSHPAILVEERTLL